MKVNLVHIIAPGRSTAQNFARRNKKYPHLIDRPEQLRGLKWGTDIYVLVADVWGMLTYTPEQIIESIEMGKAITAAGLNVHFVAMEHQIEA